METTKTVLLGAAMSIALAWSAVFVCILLNILRGRPNPDFAGGKGKYRLPATSRKPWPWWLRLLLSPVYGAFIALFAWIWVVFIVPFLIIQRGRRLKTFLQG